MHLLSELIRFLSTRPCKPSAYLDRGPSSAIRVIWLLWASSISPKGPMEQSKERPPVLPSGGRAKPGRQLRQWTLHPGPRPARPATLRPVPACGAGSHGADASPLPPPQAGYSPQHPRASVKRLGRGLRLPSPGTWPRRRSPPPKEAVVGSRSPHPECQPGSACPPE